MNMPKKSAAAEFAAQHDMEMVYVPVAETPVQDALLPVIPVRPVAPNRAQRRAAARRSR